MRKVLGAAAAILLPFGADAQALPSTVGEMQRACQLISGDAETSGPQDAIAAGACYGTIRGVVQVMQANCRSFGTGQRPAPALSVGDIPSAGDAIAAFDTWASDNSDEAEAPAEYGVIVALAQAFPCRPARPEPTSGDGRTAPESEGVEPE